jgi:hypothetical protein
MNNYAAPLALSAAVLLASTVAHAACEPTRAVIGPRPTQSYPPFGAVVYVSVDTGADPASGCGAPDGGIAGSVDSPFKTLAKGLECVANNGEVILRGGVYYEGEDREGLNFPAYWVNKTVRVHRHLDEVVKLSGLVNGAPSRVFALHMFGANSSVRGIIFENYATSETYKGAVIVSGAGAYIQDCSFNNNSYAGLSITSHQVEHNARGAVILNNQMVSNGIMGLHIDQTRDVRVENNLLAFNNTTLSPIYTTGGLKATASTNLKVKNNSFSGNRRSRGLWLDISSNNSTIVGNDFYGNEQDGLFLEVSDVADVYQNRFSGNGLTGIRIVNVDTVNIYNNSFRNNPSAHIWITDAKHRYQDICSNPAVEACGSPVQSIISRNNIFSGGNPDVYIERSGGSTRTYDQMLSANYDAAYAALDASPRFVISATYGQTPGIGDWRIGLSGVRSVGFEANGISSITTDYMTASANLIRTSATNGLGVQIPAKYAAELGIDTACNHIGALTWQ